MPHHALRAAALASIASLCSAPARADDAPPAVPEGALWLGIGSGGSPDAGAAAIGGTVATDRPIVAWLGMVVELDGTWLFREPDHFLLRIAFGPRAALIGGPGAPLRLLLAITFVHQHDAPVNVWGDDPLGSAFGESHGGLGHRSGLGHEIDLAWSPWILPRRPWRGARLALRAAFDWLPGDEGPNLYGGVHVLAGYAL